jgi:hypothetical protein
VTGRAMVITSLICATFALVGCGPTEKDLIKFGWFYRFVVELSYEDEPLTIEVIIACGSQVRQIMGEGRSARALWAPYIYGVRVKDGHGVLVQSPNVCDRDVNKNPVPADFLPVVLWAPDANDLEFLIAYLHERAYEQPVSKLKFHRATVTEATEADHEAWRAGKWKENIVPVGDPKAEQFGGASFFRGDGFFPKGDARNQGALRMECYSFVRLPMPEALRARLRERWPADGPRYWLLNWTEGDDILRNHAREINDEARRRGLWTTEGIGGNTSFYAGTGVKRPSGVGYIMVGHTAGIIAGEALRIPFRVETGYPWASDRLFTQPTIDVHADTAGGGDQGFGYCFRDVIAHYLRDRITRDLAPRDHRIFIDDQLVGVARDRRSTAPGAMIAERDEYLWKNTNFLLSHELARMQ